MASTGLTFTTRDQHRAWLATQAVLPRGFRVGTTTFSFVPAEVAKPGRMTLTLIALDRSTPDFAAVFTRNAVAGAPVLIGRRRLSEPALRAVVVNNKISNVGAPDGLAIAERLCATVAGSLGAKPGEVLPSSTGVIGWQLPIDAMVAAVPAAVQALSAESVLPAAEGIMTTDLYPKVRRAEVGGGSIVGIAKGAGMIEPNCATMLVYLLTDLAVPRGELRALLPPIVDRTFNRISIDSDTSTSDTVALLASGLAGAARPGRLRRRTRNASAPIWPKTWFATARASITCCASGSPAHPPRRSRAPWARAWSTPRWSRPRSAATTRTSAASWQR